MNRIQWLIIAGTAAWFVCSALAAVIAKRNGRDPLDLLSALVPLHFRRVLGSVSTSCSERVSSSAMSSLRRLELSNQGR